MNGKKMVWLIAILILIIFDITIWRTVPLWENQILLYLLSISLLLPLWVTQKKIHQLSLKQEKWEIQRDVLFKRNKQLTEETHQLSQFIKGVPSPIFSYDVERDQWFFSENIKELLGISSDTQQLDIQDVEEKIHQNDINRFISDKEAWILGNPTVSKYRIVIDNEQIRWIEVRTNTDAEQTNLVYGLIVDVTNYIEKEEELKQMAFYDSLTNLPNRIMLQSHLKKVISRAKRKEHDITIMFLDLDGFKNVNDTLGHDIGDILLKEVANRLNNSVREEDLISRIGGDEFILVIEETIKEEVAMIAERILSNSAKQYLIQNYTVTVTPSIGIATYPNDGQNIEDLIKNADKAMYYAKENGKANYQFYTKDLESVEPKKALIEKFLKLFQK